MQQYLTTLFIVVAKLSIEDICGGPGYTYGNSARRTKSNRKKLLQEKNPKRKYWQRVKVQHEIEHYIKRVQHERKCNIELVHYEKSAI